MKYKIIDCVDEKLIGQEIEIEKIDIKEQIQILELQHTIISYSIIDTDIISVTTPNITLLLKKVI